MTDLDPTLSTSPTAPATAWLIEADGSYWSGRSTDANGFDTDPREALRFARREDAERVRHWLLAPHAFALRVTEHMWCGLRNEDAWITEKARNEDGADPSAGILRLTGDLGAAND